jgi:hypothetical protein
MLASADGGGPVDGAKTEALVVLALALLAGVAIKVPAFFGLEWGDNAANSFYGRNFGLFVLPLLAAYFVWKRPRPWLGLALVFAAGGLFANVYPLGVASDTAVLPALRLPFALWLAVGLAYAGRRWSGSAGRMDFVRFSGELFIYYALIAFGGVALMGFTMAMFKAIGVDAEKVVLWLMPAGMVGAVLVGSWLVEAKQSVIENMAPVLTRLFTPLFTISLVAFLATMVWTGRGVDLERNALIAFDLVLALVLGLLLYSISARDPVAPAGGFDVLLVLLLISALVADGFALAAIAARISELGFTPNRVAALGENVLLLVNLAWSAVLYVRFLRGRAGFGALEGWQTAYLPVFSIWAALVVVAFPPLFGFR